MLHVRQHISDINSIMLMPNNSFCWLWSITHNMYVVLFSNICNAKYVAQIIIFFFFFILGSSK
jgi:hypothetical protein